MEKQYDVRSIVKEIFDVIDENCPGLRITIKECYNDDIIQRNDYLFGVDNVIDYMEYSKVKSLFLSRDRYNRDELYYMTNYFSAFTKYIYIDREVNCDISLRLIKMCNMIEFYDNYFKLDIHKADFYNNNIIIKAPNRIEFHNCYIDDSTHIEFIDDHEEVYFTRCKIKNSCIETSSILHIFESKIYSSTISGSSIYITDSRIINSIISQSARLSIRGDEKVQGLQTYTDLLLLVDCPKIIEDIYDLKEKKMHRYINISTSAYDSDGRIVILYDMTANILNYTLRYKKSHFGMYATDSSLEKFEKMIEAKKKEEDGITTYLEPYIAALEYLKAMVRFCNNK